MNSAQRSSSSSGLMPATRDSDSTTVRTRMRRAVSSTRGGSSSNDGHSYRTGSNGPATALSSSLLSTPSASPGRGASPIPSARIGRGADRGSRDGTGAPTFGGGLFEGSWAQSWTSVQEFAASLLAGGDHSYASGSERSAGGSASRASRTPHGGAGGRRQPPRHTADTWGPEPPDASRPGLQDVAVGAHADREASLKALRTARALGSHDGADSGLDASGRLKKRRSDEDLEGSSRTNEAEEHLVYIHHVQPSDTYAGIVLRYRCREDAFRKANGLWSRDHVQTRKWLAIPVDACEVRGRPCAGPSQPQDQVDFLAPTSDARQPDEGRRDDDFPNASANSRAADRDGAEDDTPPWSHVRWVSIDSFPTPVEIARVPQRALGYFPPRRKKTMRSASTLSTPRGSLDVPSINLSTEIMDSPRSSSSRQHSLLGGGGQHSTNFYGSSAPASSRARLNSGGDDARPAWMRRPGGVGSMARNVHAPGPANDYLNTWTRKHMPGLNIDSLPSMSVMGSEIARLSINGNEEASLVESPFAEGQDAFSASRQGGNGLDKAAAAVETWLRGAFAKRPTTPVLGPIELTDTNSDDGRGNGSSS